MAQYVDIEADGSHWVDLSDMPEHERNFYLQHIEGTTARIQRQQESDQRAAAAEEYRRSDEGAGAAGRAAAEEFLKKTRHTYFPDMPGGAMPSPTYKQLPADRALSRNEAALRRSGY